MKYEAVVIGVSAGGMTALTELFSMLPRSFRLPIIVAQHVHPAQGDFHIRYFDEKTGPKVKEAEDKAPVLPGHIYFAPPDYHLLIEEERVFSLSADEKVNHARPSIDVLFESAVDTYGARLIGIVLTGANKDGAYGLSLIKKNKGLTIVQDPEQAESPFMPQAAMALAKPEHVLCLREIGKLLEKVGGGEVGREKGDS